MKVTASIKKKDGSVTPPMTAEEINNGKYREYGVTDEDFQKIANRIVKSALELKYPDIKVQI